jgi:hypothetical protein
LHTDQEFLNTRTNLKAETSLAFGYVSPASSAKLVSWGAPLLLGKAPGDSQLEQLLSNSAAKILRGIAWTSIETSGKIEDRYQISLDPDVTKRLGPAFDEGNPGNEFSKLLPDSFRSFTVYNNKEPEAAWFSLNSAVALKLDAVSSVIFASLLKSSLAAYGIENPKDFLSALSAPLVTIRPALGENSLLLARVKNEGQLKAVLSAELLREGKGQILTGYQSDIDKSKEYAAVFIGDFVVLGKSESLSVYIAQLRNNEMIKPEHVELLKLSQVTSPVTSFTSERESIVGVISTLSSMSGRALTDVQIEEIRKRVSKIDVSQTRSSLNSTGVERRSQSAFGQFGGLLSLAQADSSATSLR